MGKPFTVIYTRASFGLCNTRTRQLSCEETMEKLEIILTFRCIVLFYTIRLQSVVQGPIEVPKTHSGVHKFFSFPTIYLCEGVFSLNALYKQCIATD